jgi:hypothetical protein
MEEIADWLETLGLGQYAQRFAENDINFSILSDLTDQDLKEIGVSSLGHRRQLLRAIGEFKNTSAAHEPFTELSSAPPTAAKVRDQHALILPASPPCAGLRPADRSRSAISDGPTMRDVDV